MTLDVDTEVAVQAIKIATLLYKYVLLSQRLFYWEFFMEGLLETYIF